MPVIDIDGEKKKVACGPCIRGHRSSKCQHSDRVLIEVRKPGRPLSACPHPSGSCGCQRAVFYTVPKNESSPTPSGPLSPAAGPFSPHPPPPPNRVQKSKLRKNSTSVNASSLQRALDNDPAVLDHQINLKREVAIPQESSETSSNVPSLVSSSSSTPQTEAIDSSVKSSSNLPPLSEVEITSPAGRLQLGMLGMGGYGTASDDLGWSGEWPDYNSIPPSNDTISELPPKKICCEGSAPPPEPKPVAATGSCCGTTVPPPNTKPVAVAGSCCASKKSQKLDEQMDTLDQSTPTLSNGLGHFSTPSHPSLASYFPYGGSTFSTPTANPAPFSEDQFGCLHEPNSSCQCGEGCECLGCSMHPANRTTTDYVRYHTELSLRGWADASHFPLYSQPAFGHQSAGFVFENGTQPFQAVSGSMHSHEGFILPQSHVVPSLWQGDHIHVATPTFEMSQFTLQQFTPLATPPAPVEPPRPQSSPQPGIEHQDAFPRSHARQFSMNETHTYDHDSPSTEDDASTLSPSAFSVQQYNIPGCNDVTGSCLCGDGCQCEGCLTHNGHENGSGSMRQHEDLKTTSASLRALGDTAFPHSSFDELLQDSPFPLTGTG